MKTKGSKYQSQRGFSMVEMIIVLVIIGIMSAIVGSALIAPRLYAAEDQTLKLIDLMREAQQRSLTQKTTVRVEINSTRRVIRLITENEPADANNDGIPDARTPNNDTILKTVPYVSNDVFIGITPSNMTATPTETIPIPPVAFANGTHPLNLGNQVVTMRFRSNGTVENAGNDAIGTNATATGATVYVWTRRPSDTSPTPTAAYVLRAATVFGSSGLTRLWKCGIVNNQCTTWTK